ncbi:MAG: NAD(+) diphosphatase [Prevotella sp.]|nr:NAD(+) diphosphatase [Prevotella sp.]
MDFSNKKHWYIFCKSDLMLEKSEEGSYAVPYSIEPPVAVKAWTTVHHVSAPDGEEVTAFAIDSPLIDEQYEMCPLRQTFYKLPASQYLTAGKCQEILYWDANTKYCGVCGSPMKLHTNISKRCTECGKEVWPQLATAVIVLIHRGDEILMVRANNFRGDFYGLVAGFVETGETLEEAVRREVREETGVEITNIRYFASQPWPYPSGLMVGFTADYVSGEVHLQRSELSSGGWFRKDNLPKLPEKLSIARKLIDSWLNE